MRETFVLLCVRSKKTKCIGWGSVALEAVTVIFHPYCFSIDGNSLVRLFSYSVYPLPDVWQLLMKAGRFGCFQSWYTKSPPTLIHCNSILQLTSMAAWETLLVRTAFDSLLKATTLDSGYFTQVLVILKISITSKGKIGVISQGMHYGTFVLLSQPTAYAFLALYKQGCSSWCQGAITMCKRFWGWVMLRE